MSKLDQTTIERLERAGKVWDADTALMKAKAFVKAVFVSGDYQDNLRELVVRRANTQIHQILRGAEWQMEEVEREHQTVDPRLEW